MKHLTRRGMLAQSVLAGTGLAVAASVGTQETRSQGVENRKTKLKIIVSGGHPGDPEYGCGGTVARYSELGHEVVLLYLNKGEPAGSSTPKGMRVKEASKACEILKARPVFAEQIDGQAIVDPQHCEEFRQLLESQKPNVVFTHWPIDNHADHRAMSMLVYDAWRRMGQSFALYYYEVSNGEDTLQFAPTHYVDISGQQALKKAACYAHASQAPDKFYSLQEQVTRLRGIESGHKQAEGFIRHIQSPDFSLPMAS